MLKDTECKAAKYQGKSYKLSDGKSLYLHVQKSGKYWRYDYSFGGKRKTLSIGVYPSVSLKEAREKRAEARTLLDVGKDPSIQKRLAKFESQQSQENTFKEVSIRWLEQHRISARSKHDIELRLKKYVYPAIGQLPLKEIKSSNIMLIIEPIKSKGRDETAKRIIQAISQVLRYGMLYNLCEHDVTYGMKGAFKSKQKLVHHPAIVEPEAFGQLLRDIDTWNRVFLTAMCLKLSPYLALRPSELREGRWAEIDFDKALWTIPGSRMKRDREHLVPLSKQVIELLKTLHMITGSGELLFPAPRSKDKAIAENAVNRALKDLGYQNKHSPHGFRSSFSTICNRAGKDSQLIETQLAHMNKDRIQAAYLHTDWLEERRKLMQWWANHIDELRKN